MKSSRLVGPRVVSGSQVDVFSFRVAEHTVDRSTSLPLSLERRDLEKCVKKQVSINSACLSSRDRRLGNELS